MLQKNKVKISFVETTFKIGVNKMLVRKRFLGDGPARKNPKNEKNLQSMSFKNYEIQEDGKKTTFFDYYSVINPFNMPISLYKYPPIFGQSNLSDFQECAAKRLALLQFLDTYSLGGEDEKGDGHVRRVGTDRNSATNTGTNTAESKSAMVRKKIYEYNFGMPTFKMAYNEKEMEDIILKDLLSHYILRIAFSKDKEKQQWFLKQELKLFTFRLNELKNIFVLSSEMDKSERGLIYLLNRENLRYEYITKPASIILGSNKDENSKSWQKYTSFIPNKDLIEKVFKVPFFPDAYLLAKDHKVCVEKCFAYVPDIYLDAILISQFKWNLKKSFEHLERNEQMLLTMYNDSRISAFLSALPKAYVAKDYRQSYEHSDETRLTPKSLYKVYTQSFPPCMRRIFVSYMKEKHLRHWGRQQLWLFLKGAGMTLDENIQTNRSMWIQPDKFDKEHRYNIRYMYGKEGKKQDFSPYNCSKIINSFPTPSGSDSHGCPFKNFDEGNLKKLLYFFGLSDEQIKNIIPLKKNNEYQMACKQYFLETHPGSIGDGVGNHPNSFYAESRKYYTEKSAETQTAEPPA